MLARFLNLRKRNKVLSNRRNHERKVVVVEEVLIYANYQNYAQERNETFCNIGRVEFEQGILLSYFYIELH